MDKLQFVSVIVTAASSVVLVVLAWVQSNVRTARLETTLDSNMKELRDDMKDIRSRLATIDNHLMTFYTVTGRLEGRIDELSRQ